MRISYNKVINKISSATFVVLLIHANSDAMRTFLWKDVFNVPSMYGSKILIIHAVSTVLIIFIVCTVIELIRIRFVEKPFFEFMDKGKEIRYLEFDKGSLYGPKVTEKITESDYFIDCYKKAASQTIEIVTNKRKENFKIKNIIAFLDNRGQGKTSMMRSFVSTLKGKNEVLNRAKNDKGKEIELSEPISEQIDKFFKAKKFLETNNIILLLLATTSFDKKRNIYFYNPDNKVIKEFYIDPFLFFVNCLDLKMTEGFKNNNKGDLYNNIEHDGDIFVNKKQLEEVAKTVICNFQIYDFYIDYLDIRYFPLGEKELYYSDAYTITHSWLEQLKSDLMKQNILYFNDTELVRSLDSVKIIINDLAKKINLHSKINIDNKKAKSK